MTKMAEAKPIKLKTLSGTVEVTGPGNETTTHTVKIEVNDLEIAVPPESWRAKAGRLFLQLLPLFPGLAALWIAAIINPSLDLQRERRQQPILVLGIVRRKHPSRRVSTCGKDQSISSSPHVSNLV
jgi:hypothetical protein